MVKSLQLIIIGGDKRSFNLVEILKKKTFLKETGFQNIPRQTNETSVTGRQIIKALSLTYKVFIVSASIV